MELERVLEYGVTKLSDVEGWLSPLDFAAMTTILVAQSTLGLQGDLAEIGVWRGKSAIVLSCFVRKPESFFAVDVFDLYYPNDPPTRPVKPYADPALFRSNLSAFGCPEGVVEVPSDTRSDATLVETLAKHGIRFFHVDGGHSYEHVVADCRTALAVTTERCVIALDDFLQVDNPAVSEAVFDVFREAPNGLVPFAATGKKLYLSNRDDAVEYWRYLTALMPEAVTRKRQLLGASLLILNPVRFRLSTDLHLSLLRSLVTEPESFHASVQRKSSRFPNIEMWLGDHGSLNSAP